MIYKYIFILLLAFKTFKKENNVKKIIEENQIAAFHNSSIEIRATFYGFRS